jgi:hypothetical protein
MSKRAFARARRKPIGRLPSEGFALVLALVKDPRFAHLNPSYRNALMHAAICFAGGDGRFWHKVKTWADECKTSTSTIERAIRQAEAVGLLRREPFLRPDGKQGSSTYFFDPRLLPTRPVMCDVSSSASAETWSITGDGACSAKDPKSPSVMGDERTSAVTTDGWTRSVVTDGPEQKVEQKKEQEEGFVLDRTPCPSVREIEDNCLVCGRRTRHLDDGKECVCLGCVERDAEARS